MTNREKIIIGITKGSWGGAQKYVFDIANELHTKKVPVSVLVGERGDLTEKLESKGIIVHCVENMGRDVKLLSEIGVLWNIFKILHKEKPGVLHTNSSKMGALGSIAGRFTGIPKIIFTAHGWAHVEERPLWQQFIIKSIHYVTVLLSHKTIAVSKIVKSQMASSLISKKIEVIHNGVENVKFIKKEEALSFLDVATRGELRGCKYIVGTISELHKNKGLGYAIEATKYMPTGTCLAIIGEGEKREELENLISKQKLNNKVMLLGHIQKASSYLKAFDIFFLSSIKEGLPYTILEAGMAQLPVVATAVGGIPEIIEDLESGLLVQSRNPKEIGAAIRFLEENKRKTKEMAVSLQKKVKQEFSKEKMLTQTIKLYNT